MSWKYQYNPFTHEVELLPSGTTRTGWWLQVDKFTGELRWQPKWGDVSGARLLENGAYRMLESGDYRLLETGGGTAGQPIGLLLIITHDS